MMRTWFLIRQLISPRVLQGWLWFPRQRERHERSGFIIARQALTCRAFESCKEMRGQSR
jgi:hypothetical protein